MEMSTLLAVFVFIVNLFWNFLLCHTGTASSDVIASISDIIYNGNWLKYPLDYQKHVLLMLLRSQRPVYFMGFKMVRCTWENFTSVSSEMSYNRLNGFSPLLVFPKLTKAAGSYYLILRNLSTRPASGLGVWKRYIIGNKQKNGKMNWKHSSVECKFSSTNTFCVRIELFLKVK